jgi:hypothetical protein
MAQLPGYNPLDTLSETQPTLWSAAL